MDNSGIFLSTSNRLEPVKYQVITAINAIKNIKKFEQSKMAKWKIKHPLQICFPECTQKESGDSFWGNLEEWYTIYQCYQNHIGQFFLYE